MGFKLISFHLLSVYVFLLLDLSPVSFCSAFSSHSPLIVFCGQGFAKEESRWFRSGWDLFKILWKAPRYLCISFPFFVLLVFLCGFVSWSRLRKYLTFVIWIPMEAGSHWASREPSLKRRTMSLPNCDNSCGRGPMDETNGSTNGSQSKLKWFITDSLLFHQSSILVKSLFHGLTFAK